MVTIGSKIRLGLFLCLIAFIATGCRTQTPTIEIGKVAAGQWFSSLSTDKSIYSPGQSVQFTLTMKEAVKDANAIVRYKHLNDAVKEEKLVLTGSKTTSWNWLPPQADYQGYMVEVFLQKGQTIADQMNIAVDVSSDWGKFPRYGFLADFQTTSPEDRKAVIDRLTRGHINGIQFYDWQYKHNMPLKEENGKPAAEWKDIANRQVSYDTVKGYLDLAHGKNMKAMNYNLLFGAYADYEADGAKKEWGIYKDADHTEQDMHPLPGSWASSLYLMDPTNKDWQNYIFQAEKKTFAALPFDGWHVDQLGDRGARWDYLGNKVNLDQTYGSFLQKAKEQLNVDYVMNAVGQYGQIPIATKAPVKFLYTEVWDSYPKYNNLKDIIDFNSHVSQGKLNTVLAAYMDYNLANSKGQFNAAGVLLTDSVIFASGGSHLELGEHMLGKEYFPNDNLKMSDALVGQITNYYDFLTGYENLLRDNVVEGKSSLKSTSDLRLSSYAELGKVWTFTKHKENKDIIHLLNFTDATSLIWKDAFGKQPEPAAQVNLPFSISAEKKIAKIWLASPDFAQGSSVSIPFQESAGNTVSFTVPQLKYWDMIVVEYAK